ncbi:DNA-binding HxlR family transcriptional regulator [Hamadaea flava]|uniref:Winged helix-turn-helix transcriptional regulator n=1 Tax=Hamadaea flava TaxID=1742688 RepID=A0ABV8LMF8_9ACTN|nr:helix-turn-helix domain-containing protein [Hamadaea flava]MCP2329693.1 DNA-binding HxlR family transcriptional regulator [Hamadaea flava]
MTTLSAAERRAAERIAYDAYLAACPARKLLDRISDKWVSLVLTALADGPRRQSDLARFLAGASQKMLTQTLRALERDGIVDRTVTPTVPIRVDYALTDLGRSLLPVIAAIKGWAESHLAEVECAQLAYDQANREPDAGRRSPGPARDQLAAVRNTG